MSVRSSLSFFTSLYVLLKCAPMLPSHCTSVWPNCAPYLWGFAYVIPSSGGTSIWNLTLLTGVESKHIKWRWLFTELPERQKNLKRGWVLNTNHSSKQVGCSHIAEALCPLQPASSSLGSGSQAALKLDLWWLRKMLAVIRSLPVCVPDWWYKYLDAQS